MPASVAIPLITGVVGAGATIIAADKGANAAKTAAGQETAGANNALDVQKQIYQQQQQNLAPYQQLGASSLGNLQSLANQPVVSQNPSGWGYSARGLPQSGSLGALGSSSQTPQMGQTRTFQNGKVGIWDGQGWKAQ